MLYPQENECREVRDLSGIWRFKLDAGNRGREEGWQARPLADTVSMPVPSSYNDISQDASFRDHVGDAWYERDFIVTPSLRDRRVVLRFGGASHSAKAWLNGRQVVEHAGPGLPFESEVTDLLDPDHPNRLSVVVNNVLDWTTLPPGEVKHFDDVNRPGTGLAAQEYFHDFFNYAGLDRPVKLSTTPRRFISDATVTTDVRGAMGLIAWSVEVSEGNPAIRVSLLDESGASVAAADGRAGELSVPGARLWQPGRPYLYTLLAETVGEDGRREDCYRLAVGIRSVRVTRDAFLINGAPFYFRGFGKHEDSDIRGKGLDNALNVKDLTIMKWMGANSFRTSHYPYSDEIMDLADREGIVVIDEMPAVGMHFFKDTEKVFTQGRVGEKSLQRHLQAAQELIARDKNHPCVVMWSVGNEAATYEKDAGPHFRKVLERTRQLDPSRPVTLVHANSSDALRSVVGDLFDVICVNEYHGWYIETGHLQLIEQRLLKELREVHQKYGKPVMVTEFGAEAIAGLHKFPPLMFTEEFQCEFLEHYFAAFDQLDFIIGEHVWCFADFATKQELSRVVGNRKGVFTRQRDPKASAHLLRKRWTAAG
jgi:beta-glucuronidase